MADQELIVISVAEANEQPPSSQVSCRLCQENHVDVFFNIFNVERMTEKLEQFLKIEVRWEKCRI